MIPLTVLTGFFGSGKTTVLNRLLGSPAMEGSAVVVNEIGDIGIDHDLVLEGDDQALVLDGGCLCCNMRGTVVETVARLVQTYRVPVRRVFLETSGAADPLPVLAALAAAPELSGRVALRRVVTVVDATLGAAALPRHEEARRQVAVADTLFLSKTDIGDASSHASTARSARTINPRAELFSAPHGRLPDAFVAEMIDPEGAVGMRWRTASTGDVDGDATGLAHLGHGFVTTSVRIPGELPQDAVEQWLPEILSCYGGHVLRIKGILRMAGIDGPVVLHGVQHIVSAPEILPAWPSGDSASRLVVIAQGMDAAVLKDSLTWLAGQSTGKVLG